MTDLGRSYTGMTSTSQHSRTLVIQQWLPQRMQRERIPGIPSRRQLCQFTSATVAVLMACLQFNPLLARSAAARQGVAIPVLLQLIRCVMERRRAALQDRDIVAHLRLSQQLKEKLTACQAVHGQAFEAAFSQLSPSVAEQLKGALG